MNVNIYMVHLVYYIDMFIRIIFPSLRTPNTMIVKALIPPCRSALKKDFPEFVF